MIISVNLKFFRNASEIYGQDGLNPATQFSVGVDLRACLENSQPAKLTIQPGERAKIGSGIAIEPLLESLATPLAAPQTAPSFNPSSTPLSKRTGVEFLPNNPPAVAGFVYSRSGLGAKEGLVVAQGVGVIDPDYRGEIIVWLLNTSQTPISINQGDRIAQLVFLNYYQPAFNIVTQLGTTQRGAGGFGHTGK